MERSTRDSRRGNRIEVFSRAVPGVSVAGRCSPGTDCSTEGLGVVRRWGRRPVRVVIAEFELAG